jgi:DNA-binding NtrC family response regulator
MILAYRWPGNVRELQNTIERAVILSESGRPVLAAALGMPDDLVFPDTLHLPISEENTVAEAPADLPEADSAPAVPAAHVSANGQGVQRLSEIEKQAIQAALQQTAGNRTQAAAVLGISIRTLRNKLQEYRESGSPLDVQFDNVDA